MTPPEPVNVDDLIYAEVQDHEQRLRVLESTMIELTTSLNVIAKLARVGLFILAAGLGVDISGVEL
jgi:hypothetical protein